MVNYQTVHTNLFRVTTFPKTNAKSRNTDYRQIHEENGQTFLLNGNFVDHFFLVCSLRPCGHLLGKGQPLGSHVCNVVLCFVAFLYGVLGQVCYSIVSISNPCLLTYFYYNLDCLLVWKPIGDIQFNNKTFIYMYLKILLYLCDRHQLPY